MTSRAIRVALLVPALAAVGCGTASNLIGAGPGKKVPFGGVHHDIRCLNHAADGQFGGRSEAESYPRLMTMVLCAADLPLSFVADAVTWPYTCSYTYVNSPTDYPPLLITPPGGGPAVPHMAPQQVPAEIPPAQPAAPAQTGAPAAPAR